MRGPGQHAHLSSQATVDQDCLLANNGSTSKVWRHSYTLGEKMTEASGTKLYITYIFEVFTSKCCEVYLKT